VHRALGPSQPALCELEDARAVVAGLKLIYRSDADRQLAVFEAAWNAKYGSVGQLGRRHWEQVVPFLHFL
jgi:transposase-like protein